MTSSTESSPVGAKLIDHVIDIEPCTAPAELDSSSNTELDSPSITELDDPSATELDNPSTTELDNSSVPELNNLSVTGFEDLPAFERVTPSALEIRSLLAAELSTPPLAELGAMLPTEPDTAPPLHGSTYPFNRQQALGFGSTSTTVPSIEQHRTQPIPIPGAGSTRGGSINNRRESPDDDVTHEEPYHYKHIRGPAGLESLEPNGGFEIGCRDPRGEHFPGRTSAIDGQNSLEGRQDTFRGHEYTRSGGIELSDSRDVDQPGATLRIGEYTTDHLGPRNLNGYRMGPIATQPYEATPGGATQPNGSMPGGATQSNGSMPGGADRTTAGGQADRLTPSQIAHTIEFLMDQRVRLSPYHHASDTDAASTGPRSIVQDDLQIRTVVTQPPSQARALSAPPVLYTSGIGNLPDPPVQPARRHRRTNVYATTRGVPHATHRNQTTPSAAPQLNPAFIFPQALDTGSDQDGSVDGFDGVNDAPARDFAEGDLTTSVFNNAVAAAGMRDPAIQAGLEGATMRPGKARAGFEGATAQWQNFHRNTGDANEHAANQGDLHAGQLHRLNKVVRGERSGGERIVALASSRAVARPAAPFLGAARAAPANWAAGMTIPRTNTVLQAAPVVAIAPPKAEEKKEELKGGAGVLGGGLKTSRWAN